MSKHIGIVACSYEGAALSYQTICNEGARLLGDHAHPEVSLHNHSLSQYMKYIVNDDWEGVAKLMLSSAEKLAKAGADFLICPDNTIHQSFPLVRGKSPLPWLHIAEEVSFVAKKEEYKKVGILGTRFLMEGPVYPEKFEEFNIKFALPATSHRIRINEIIFNELVYGIIKEGSRRYFLSVIDELKLIGCDSVVLGCTEIPLIVLPEDSSLPVLDSTRILSRAALKHAVSNDS
jgi:aspartate racemase